MATIYRSLLNSNFSAGSTSDVFFEPYSIKATNDRWPAMVLIMNNGASPEEFFSEDRIPDDYAGSACVIWDWTTTATTGSVVLQTDYRSASIGESLDQTGQDESASITACGPGTANAYQESRIPLTGANLAPGDRFQVSCLRDPTAGGDDMAAAMIIRGVYLGYQDS